MTGTGSAQLEFQLTRMRLPEAPRFHERGESLLSLYPPESASKMFRTIPAPESVYPANLSVVKVVAFEWRILCVPI